MPTTRSKTPRGGAQPGRHVQREMARHPFFRGLSSGQLRALAPFASAAVYEAGRFIFREGDPADRFYAIQDGRVSLEIMEPGSSGVSLQRLGGGEVLGWSWLVPPYRKRFDAKALEPVRALVFDAKRLRRALAQDAALSNAVLQRLLQVVGSRLQAARLQLLDAYNIPR